MKKLIIAIFIILFCAFQANAWNPMVMSSGNTSVASCSTTSVIFWWRCEALDFSATNGTLDYSANDDTGTTGSAAAINTAAVKNGTNGLDLPTSGDYVLFGTPSATLDDEGRIGFWARFTDYGEGNTILTLYDDVNNFFRLLMSGTDELSFVWTDSGTSRTALTTSAANISVDGSTWYFIEIAWKTSTNYREIFVDGSSEGSASSTIASFATAVVSLYVGELLAANTSDYHIDHFIVSTDSTDNLYLCKDRLNYDGS